LKSHKISKSSSSQNFLSNNLKDKTNLKSKFFEEEKKSNAKASQYSDEIQSRISSE